MNKKILVIGGSGFIGTNIVEYYSKKGIEILNLDKNPPKNHGQIIYWKSCDVLNYQMLFNIIKQYKPIYVIDLAARIDLKGKSILDYKQNIDSVRNIIQCCNEIDGVKKIIFTSSMLVCKAGFVPKSYSEYNPDTFYGQSKVDMELYIKNTTIKPDWTIVRLTSIWGPWFDDPYRRFFRMIKNKRYYGIKNACQKSYGYVGNIVYMYDMIMMYYQEKTNKKIFYLGDNEPVDINEWSIEIATEMRVKKPLFIDKKLMFIFALLGDLIQRMGINTPISTFRFKNMTTNNVISMDDVYDIIGDVPYTRLAGIKETLKWMNIYES